LAQNLSSDKTFVNDEAQLSAGGLEGNLEDDDSIKLVAEDPLTEYKATITEIKISGEKVGYCLKLKQSYTTEEPNDYQKLHTISPKDINKQNLFKIYFNEETMKYNFSQNK